MNRMFMGIITLINLTIFVACTIVVFITIIASLTDARQLITLQQFILILLTGSLTGCSGIIIAKSLGDA